MAATGRRFHVSDFSSTPVRLSAEQARHARAVLRMQVGDAVELVDDRGVVAAGRISRLEKSSFVVDVVGRVPSPESPGPQLILATAIPKGERADWMIEKSAELGVNELVPLLTERSIVRPGPERLARWRRKVVAAVQQAGPGSVMRIGSVTELAKLQEAIEPGCTIWCADPEAAELTWMEALTQVDPTATSRLRAVVLVGPEGGFGPRDREDMAGLGARRVRLGAATLRIETACIAAAAVWDCWRSCAEPRFNAAQSGKGDSNVC